MSENAVRDEGPQPDERDLEETPVPPVAVVPDDGVREIRPIVWLEDPTIDENLYDFRPIDRDGEGEEAALDFAPKALSAVVPVASSTSPVDTDTPENPAPVVKDSGQPKANASGTPTSSVSK